MPDDPPVLDVASTALFVELVVIGCGTAAALALAAAGVYGWHWLEVIKDAGPLVVALLAGVYVLGIITDRLADRLGEPLSRRWRTRLYRRAGQDPRDYAVDLLLVLHDGPLSSRLAYGRSRLRVVRGWTLNSVGAVLALVEYVLLQLDDRSVAKLAVGLLVGFVLIGVGCAFAWRRLAVAQFEQVGTQARTIRARPGAGGPPTGCP